MILLARGAAAYEFTSKAELKTACYAWLANPSNAEATYGHISTWGTEQITVKSESSSKGVNEQGCKSRVEPIDLD